MKTSKTGPRLKKPGGEGLLRASPFLLPSLIGLAILSGTDGRFYLHQPDRLEWS